MKVKPLAGGRKTFTLKGTMAEPRGGTWGPHSLYPHPMAVDRMKVNPRVGYPNPSTLNAKLKAAWNAGALWLACALSCTWDGAKAHPCASWASRSRALSGAAVTPAPDSSWKGGAGVPLKAAQLREVGDTMQSPAAWGTSPAAHRDQNQVGTRAHSGPAPIRDLK